MYVFIFKFIYESNPLSIVHLNLKETYTFLFKH